MLAGLGPPLAAQLRAAVLATQAMVQSLLARTPELSLGPTRTSSGPGTGRQSPWPGW